jgi:hypothetical protein
MSKEQRLKIIGILIVIPLILGSIYLAFRIGFQNPSSDNSANNSTSTTSQNSSSLLAQPIDVEPVPDKKTELRVDFTNERYNERVRQLNNKILILKNFTIYEPSREFCDAIGNVRAESEFTLNPLELDINFNSKAPLFEKIVNDTRGLEIACEQHLAGSTGLLEDYKKQYLEYIKNLNELPKV